MAFEHLSGTPRAQEDNLYGLRSPGRELRVKLRLPLSEQTAQGQASLPCLWLNEGRAHPRSSLPKPHCPGWRAPGCRGGAPRARSAKKGTLELKETQRGSCLACLPPAHLCGGPHSMRSLCERRAVARPGRKHGSFPLPSRDSQCAAPEAPKTSAPRVKQS